MRKLPATAPEIYDSFMQGKCVVKRTVGHFNSVGADQALEQTINHSQKNTPGIIGSTRRKNFAAKWKLIFHEMLAVKMLHRAVTGVEDYNEELAVQKELSETKGAEKKVKSMVDYIRLRENPFDIDNIPTIKLHNILTKEEMDNNIRNDLLNIEKIGLELYTKLRQERFVKKEKKISDNMHGASLKNFKSIHEKKSTSAVKKNVTLKESALAQKVIELAPLPVEMNSFWPSNTNKFKLECLVSSWVERNCGKEYPQVNFVLSSFFSDDTIEQCKSLKSAHVEQSDLNSDAEEADERLIVHAMHSATHDIEKITILSNDTDVVVLFMHYWKNLKDAGLQELWIRAGLGDTTRYILIHVLAVKSPFTDNIISIHVLTGCEYTSKVGTQAAALKADIQLIKDFSTTLDLEKTEEYLVLVIKLKDNG